MRAIGVLEALGALGLVLPPPTGIAIGLDLAAAIGLVLVQIGGMILHRRRGEAKQIGLNIALLIAAGVAAWPSTAWLWPTTRPTRQLHTSCTGAPHGIG